MNRIAYMVIRNLGFIPGWLYQVNRLGKQSDHHTEEDKYQYLRRIVKKLNHSAYIDVQEYGIENLPKENGFLITPNHQGLFDMLALIDTCPKPLGVVIKKEASQLILVKQVIRLIGGIAIDRSDIKESMKVILQVSEEMKNGRNFVIFPEGTRSHEENKILDFKAGTFKSAVKSKCPIVPTALINSYQPFDISSIKKVTVQVHYLTPLYPEQYMGMKTAEIAHIVHDRIQEEICRNI